MSFVTKARRFKKKIRVFPRNVTVINNHITLEKQLSALEALGCMYNSILETVDLMYSSSGLYLHVQTSRTVLTKIRNEPPISKHQLE